VKKIVKYENTIVLASWLAACCSSILSYVQWEKKKKNLRLSIWRVFRSLCFAAYAASTKLPEGLWGSNPPFSFAGEAHAPVSNAEVSAVLNNFISLFSTKRTEGT